MIDGIGIDLVEIGRVRQAIDRWGDRFLNRIFTASELEYCYGHRRGNPYASLAARFAAKEAVMKSMGTGWSQGVKWTDIEVAQNAAGAPFVRMTGRALELIGPRTILISLSHTEDYAVASAVLVSSRPGAVDDTGASTGSP